MTFYKTNMAKNPLVVLRVGYMVSYDGPKPISGGGAYVEQNGVGGEVYNFKPSQGTCYGYAMSISSGGIDLGKLDSTRRWKVGDELDGVDVVFIAKRPGYGQVVVGWYRDATVFHKTYQVRRGKIQGMDHARRSYLCTANVGSVHLLPETSRTMEILHAPAGNVGFTGQSNVWYPTEKRDYPKVVSFLKELRRYINSKPKPLAALDEEDVGGAGANNGGRGGRRGRKPDAAHNAEVELKAVEAVKNKYKKAGYTVESVEKDNCGWDLVAKKGKQKLYIEVKGCAGSTIYFELTPNEYKKLQEHSDRYRVCIVCEALDTPIIYDFGPAWHSQSKKWRLSSTKHGAVVTLSERVAAVGAEITIT